MTTSKTPTPTNNTIRLSFRLQATEKSPIRTTSVSLKDDLVSFWIFAQFYTDKSVKPKEGIIQHTWKKELYDFLGPLLKEEHSKNPACSLSKIAFNILMQNIIETFIQESSKSSGNSFNSLDMNVIEKITGFLGKSLNKKPDLVIDVKKVKKKKKRKVKILKKKK